MHDERQPLLRRYQHQTGTAHARRSNIEKQVPLKSGLTAYEEFFGANDPHSWSARMAAIKEFGFAVLTREVIEVLRSYAPLLEIGAGSGYWAYELNNAEVPCVATDPEPYSCVRTDLEALWLPVVRLSADEAIKRYGAGRALLAVWPSYNQDWCAAALEQHHAADGQWAIIAHEGVGNCIGNDRMFDVLARDWVSHRIVELPQWSGIRDYLEIFRRRLPHDVALLQ